MTFLNSGAVAMLPLAVLLVAGCRNPEAAKQEFLDSGTRYLAEGRVREAVAEYQNAIQTDPRFGEARLKLAEAYVLDNQPVRALSESVRAADLLPDDRSAQLQAGRLLLLSGQFDDAKTRAERLLATNPRDVDAHIIVGKALAGVRDLDGAIAQVQEAVEIDPDRSASFLNLGALEDLRGRPAEAEAFMKKGLQIAPASVEARLTLAYFYWAHNRRAEAEEALKQALAIEPASGLANRTLAAFYVGTNRPTLAEPYLRKAADVDDRAKLALADYLRAMRRPAEAEPILETLSSRRSRSADPATVRLAALKFADGRRDEARTLVDQVLARQANNTDALLLSSRILAADGQLAKGLVQARQAADSNPQSAQAQFVIGRLLLVQNERDQAAAAFREALRINPRAAEAQVELARLELAAGRADASVPLAEQAVRIQPGNADANLTLTRGLIAQGDTRRAEPIMQRLVEAFPRSAPVLAQMGALQLRKGDVEAARRSFQQAWAIDQGSIEALAGLSAIDLSQRRPNDAIVRVEQLVQRNPRDTHALMLLARTYGTTGNLPKMEEALRRALQSDGSLMQAYAMLGQLFLRQRRLDEARKEFGDLASRQPRSVAAQTMVATILDIQGRTNEARQRYELVLSIDPEAPVAANNLAWMHVETNGNLDVALQLAQTASRALPDDPDVNDTLGWIYYKKDLASLAIPPLVKSVEKAPDNPLLHFHLGLAYAKAGDAGKARGSLERALELQPTFDGADEARRVLSSLRG